MLLIGDIHIHPRYSESIIQMLRTYIASYPDEQQVVFVGDYVYHFSYHRVSLLALLDFFIELAHEGRQITILAGNHDRLGQHFVYTEAEKILSHASESIANLRFITSPKLTTAQGEHILFLPYHLSRSGYTPQSDQYDFPAQLQACQHSDHQTTKHSYLLNTYLADHIVKHKSQHGDTPLTVIHHYYTADTKFPGLKAQFGYNSLALSPHRCTQENLRLISGHIHHSFVYHNYLCIGAVRSTSPLETNLYQYLRQYRDGQAHATQVAHNPYLTLTIQEKTIDADTLERLWSELREQSTQQLQSKYYTITTSSVPLPHERTTLTLTGQDISYEKLQDYIEPQLNSQLQDLKIKHDLNTNNLVLDQFITQDTDFSSGRGNRKSLLDDYLQQKFGGKINLYHDTLRELGI